VEQGVLRDTSFEGLIPSVLCKTRTHELATTELCKRRESLQGLAKTRGHDVPH